MPRSTKSKRSRRSDSAGHEAPAPALDRFLDSGLAIVVGIVPLVFYPKAFNTNLVKDVALGGLVSLMAAVLLIAAFRGRRISWPRSPVNAAVWAMILSSLLAFALSGYRYAGMGALLRLASGALLYLLLIAHMGRAAQARRLLWAAAVGAVLASIYGTFQRFGVDFVTWSAPVERIPGPYGNATYFASYLVLLLPVMAALAIAPPVGPRFRNGARLFFALASALMLACLMWTQTVAAIGGLGIASGMAAIAAAYYRGGPSRRRTSPKAGLVAALLVVAAWSLAAGLAPAAYRARVRSLAHPTNLADVRRVLIWKTALRIFTESPLAGAGPGTYQIYSRGRYAPLVSGGRVREASGAIHAHNAFLETLSETGALGGLAFIWLIAVYFWSAARAVRRALDPFWRSLVIALAAGALAYLIQNLFAVTFFIAGCQMFFWLALALTVAAGQQGESPAPVRSVSLRLRGVALWAAAAAVVVVVLVSWAGAWRAVLAEYHYWNGEALGDRRMFQQAAQQLEQAVALNPYCQRAWYQLGASRGIMGQWQAAVNALRRSEALSPDYLRTQYDLGVAYFSLEQYARAARAFRRAVRAEPSALNYRALSDAYARQGDLVQAVTVAEQAVRKYPRDVSLRQHAARLLLQTGDRARARREIDSAARLDPLNPETQRLRAELQAGSE